MEVSVLKSNTQKNLKQIRQRIGARIPQSQLANALVSFFETPESSQWFEFFQDDFAYVILKQDFRITLDKDKLLVLHLDSVKEIAKVPPRLKTKLSEKIREIFQGE